jgi:hypothetical protein
METIVRQATKDDVQAIWTFINHAYGSGQKGMAQFKYPERWIWQYIGNPFISEPDHKLPIWVAIKDNRVVGQMCAIPAKMKIGSQIYNGGWGCDFIVSPECRGEGIGHKLTKMYYEHFQVGVGLSMADSTRRIWAKFDPVRLRPMYIYWYPVRLNKNIVYQFVSDKFEGRPKFRQLFKVASKYLYIHAILAELSNALFIIRRQLNFMRKKKLNPFIREISEFDNEIDTLSGNIHEDYAAIVRRESKLLNWRFIHNKQLKYRVFVSGNDSLIKGYIVLRKQHPAELNIGHIVDFYAAKNDINTIGELIFFATKFFGKSVDIIKCATSLIAIENILKKYGFLKVEKIRPLVLVPDPKIKEKIRGISEDWFITLADQDLDQIVCNLDFNQLKHTRKL